MYLFIFMGHGAAGWRHAGCFFARLGGGAGGRCGCKQKRHYPKVLGASVELFFLNLPRNQAYPQ